MPSKHLRGALVVWVALAGVASPTWAETWNKLATSGLGPSERSSPAVAALGSSIYVFGGVKDDFTAAADTFFQDLYRLDITTGQWEAVLVPGAAPPPRAFAGAVADTRRGQIVIFGGAHYGPGFSDFVGYDDLWTFAPAAGTWQRRVPRNRGPIGRSAPTVFIDRSRIYVFGGVTAAFETLNDLWVYDLDSNRWKELSRNGAPDAPPSRHEAMSGSEPVRGRLLLYGGEHFDPAAGFTVLNDTWEYDLGCGRWQQIRPRPDIEPGRNYAAPAVLGKYLYLQGGDLPGGSSGCGAPFPQNPTEQLWRYHIARQRWEAVTPAGDPLARLKRHEATVARGRMYVLGGWDFQCDGTGPGQIWNLEVFALTPD